MQKRADIQSLRALAILVVLMGHAHFVRGGYVGVDVFFVLSGYLITGLIVREDFRALDFYARRLKRLLPALFVVLLAAWAIASLIGIPGQFQDAQAAEAASIWGSNFWFSARVVNYFSAGDGSNLFLHTWSLGVEEQFYLIWPWLVLFLFGRSRNRRHLIGGLTVVAVLSMAINLYLVRSDFEAAFYLMPSRAWEFALGGIVFLSGKRFRIPIGWPLILIATLFYTPDLTYPGFWAILPCTGTAFALMDQPSGIYERFINSRPIQFLGDISYSLYLWHWPVLLLGVNAFGDSVAVRAALIVLSILLAAITYILIENPIRNLKLNAIMVLIPATLCIAFTFTGMATWAKAAREARQAPGYAHIISVAFDAPSLYNRPRCDTWYHSAELSVCRFGKGSPKVVLFGDSVMMAWFPAFRKNYGEVTVLTKSACPASDINYYYTRIKAFYRNCMNWRRSAIAAIRQIHPHLLVMGSARYPFTRTEWIDGTRETLFRLRDIPQIILFNPPPVLPFNGPKCLLDALGRPSWLPKQTCDYRPSADKLLTILRYAAKPFPNVQVVNMDNAVCPHGICKAEIGQQITYRDAEHLTASFVKSLAPQMAQTLHKLIRSRQMASK